MINLEELKQTIEERTGIPSKLLKGENAEEIIVSAKALLTYRREQETQRPRSTAEQFKEWIDGREGIEAQDTAGAALADIEEAVRIEGGGYPRITDAGEVTGLPDPRNTQQQFSEWFSNKSALDPFKKDGWRPII
jgi:hypothetical protein